MAEKTITSLEILHKAGLVQDVLDAMPQARKLAGATLCMAIHQYAVRRTRKIAGGHAVNVVSQDAPSPVGPSARKQLNCEMLKCAAFLLSAMRQAPALQRVKGSDMPAALLTLWMETDAPTERTANSCPATPSAPSREEVESTSRKNTLQRHAEPFNSATGEKRAVREKEEKEKASPYNPLLKEKQEKENLLLSDHAARPATEAEWFVSPENDFSEMNDEAYGINDGNADDNDGGYDGGEDDDLAVANDNVPPPTLPQDADNVAEPEAEPAPKGKKRKKPRTQVDYTRWTENDFRTEAEKYHFVLPTEDDFDLFVYYWTERTKTGRMRFQYCKTFSCQRRMATWKNKGKQIKAEEARRLEAKYGKRTDPVSAAPPTEEEVTAYAATQGMDTEEARTFFYYYQARSWRMQGQPIADWKAALFLWMQRKTARRNNQEKQTTNTFTQENNGQRNNQQRYGRPTSKAEANAEVDDFAKRLIDNERRNGKDSGEDFLSLMGDGDKPILS